MKPDFTETQAIIFDLDGTLIDSEGHHAAGFARAVEELSGYRITESERREFFESHTDVFTPVLAARHGLDLNPAEVLRIKRAHVKKNFKTDLFPLAVPFIKKWRGRKRMALASNSPRHFVSRVLVDARMIDLFEAVCTADDVARRKPDPEIYRLILTRMDLEPADVMVLEDSPAGVAAAQKAGCPVLMVENGAGRSVDGVEKYTWKELTAF